MRIQVEFPEAKVADLKSLMEKGGVKTYYDLFNHALSLLKWSAHEVVEGNAIAAINEQTGKTRYLVTPFLQEVARHHPPKSSPVKNAPSPKAKGMTSAAPLKAETPKARHGGATN